MSTHKALRHMAKILSKTEFNFLALNIIPQIRLRMTFSFILRAVAKLKTLAGRGFNF